VFTTEKSLIYEHFETELPSWLRRVSRIHEEWSPCKQILEDHHAPVSAAIFLPDNWRLASASNDKTIRLWDTRTGECERVFRGHESAINDVAASPDGQRLASAGNDKTVRLWEIATEECMIVLVGHRSSVKTVAFSLGGRWLASGSNDKTIRVWNALTYEFERALQHPSFRRE
jgi:WD40 repeat protein